MEVAMKDDARKKRSTSFAKRKPTGDYEVGYARAPTHSQYKKGEVPPHRQKKQRARKWDDENFLDIFKRVCAEKVRIRQGDTVKIVTRGQAVMEANYHVAMAGDQSAMQNMLPLLEEAALFKDRSDPNEGPMLRWVARNMTVAEWENKYRDMTLEDTLKKQKEMFDE
jgi:hypothetical protein